MTACMIERMGRPQAPRQSQSRVSPFGVASLSGVAVPGFTGPFTPLPDGIFVPLAEPVTDPDPSVVALPVVAVLVPDLSPGIGTLGAIALGEALWFGAGVGEPRLSYCCCANATLLRSTIAEARMTGFFVMVSSFVAPAGNMHCCKVQRGKVKRCSMDHGGRTERSNEHRFSRGLQK